MDTISRLGKQKWPPLIISKRLDSQHGGYIVLKKQYFACHILSWTFNLPPPHPPPPYENFLMENLHY